MKSHLSNANVQSWEIEVKILSGVSFETSLNSYFVNIGNSTHNDRAAKNVKVDQNTVFLDPTNAKEIS